MDRRTSVALAVFLLTTAGGCLSKNKPPEIPPQFAGMSAAPAEQSKQAPAPKKKATPEPLVAFGDLHASRAKQIKGSADANAAREQARQAYQQALAIDANHKAALVGLAKLYVQAEDHEHAIVYYRKVLEKHPKDGALWLEAGICHARKKDWAPAIDCMRKAHAIDPDNRDYGTNLGLTLARAGQFDEAAAVMGKVMNRGEAHYNVARMLERFGRYDDSRRHLQIALQHKPDLAPAQQMLAQLSAPPAAVLQAGFSTGGTVPPE